MSVTDWTMAFRGTPYTVMLSERERERERERNEAKNIIVTAPANLTALLF
jgi:hypothetical protein